MITVTEYKNQKVGVFGLGKAGEAAVCSLLAGGAEVYAWDDCLSSPSPLPNPPPQGGRELSKIPSSAWDWENLKALVLSPGVPLTHPAPHPVVALAHKYNVPVIGEVELLFRTQPDATYIGITGTNGKSTTTTLIGHILKEAGVICEIGGNLGTPALALAPLGKGGVYVVEMSSYQLDLLKSVRFNVAVLLNITPDHIDRHGDMAGYIAAKKHIFDRQTAGDVAVVDIGIRQEALGIREARIIKISADKEIAEGVYAKDGVLHDKTSPMPNAQSLMPLTAIASLTGKHNWQNAAAAYAACRAVGVAPEKIYAAMQSFAGLRHRMQLVVTIKGVRFVNDSKATNADATSNALAAYDNIYWIAGGKAKDGGISGLGQYFSKITHAFLIGEAAEEFAKTLEGKVAYTQCGTLEVAVARAAEVADKDSGFGIRDSGSKKDYSGVVLLSPACASFDQFKSFEHRGDVFCELVEKINGS
ncbi:MAG: UDP-N-acetylmuramoyl-L-alanine--D-glutamate ligase [Pseudomonadota bacterium]